jgi:hypothetical protein
MTNSSHPDLVKVTEIFLIPSSFLVAALGTADSNPHRAGVSIMGLVISSLWWVCCSEARAELHPPNSDAAAAPTRRIRIMSWLPAFFVACWALSVVVHVVLWGQPLGH